MRRIKKVVNWATTGFLYDSTQAIAELRGGSIDIVYHTGIQIDEVPPRFAPTGYKILLSDALMSLIAQADNAVSVSFPGSKPAPRLIDASMRGAKGRIDAPPG